MDVDKQALKDNGSKYKISWESINWMDTTIIDNINKTVGVDDVLINLGDVLFGGNYLQRATQYLSRINCKNLYLVKGNHDKSEIQSLFAGFYDILETTINGQRVVACHRAVLTWKGITLFGHSHSTLNSWLDFHLPDARMLDVGIDNAYQLLGEYRPFSFDEVVRIVDNRSTNHVAIDHH